jgi:hypothetical protein
MEESQVGMGRALPNAYGKNRPLWSLAASAATATISADQHQ